MCRANSEGGRRCGLHGEARNAADRARRALVRAGAHVLTVEPLFIPSGAEFSYGTDEYDIDGEPIEGEAEVEVSSVESVSGYVGSVDDIHKLLRGLGSGAHGTLVMLHAAKRDSTGVMTDHEHAEAGRVQHVTRRLGEGSYELEDGRSFPVGRPENWAFENGLGIFETAGVRYTYRFSGPVIQKTGPTVSPQKAKSQLDFAATNIQQSLGSLTDGITGSPETAFADYAASNAIITEKLRMLDIGAAKVLGVSSDVWSEQKDGLLPQLLAAEILANHSYIGVFESQAAALQTKMNRYQKSGHNTSELFEQLEDLRGALRGVNAKARILERRSQAAKANA
jgi:hypothetical protein